MIVNANSSLVLAEFANTLAAAARIESDPIAGRTFDSTLRYLYNLCGEYDVNLDGLRRAAMFLEGSYMGPTETQPQQETNPEFKIVEDGDVPQDE